MRSRRNGGAQQQILFVDLDHTPPPISFPEPMASRLLEGCLDRHAVLLHVCAQQQILSVQR